MKRALGRDLSQAMRWQVVGLLATCLAGVAGLLTGNWWVASTNAALASPVSLVASSKVPFPSAVRSEPSAGVRSTSPLVGASKASDDAMWEAFVLAVPAVNPGVAPVLPEGWRFGGFFATEKGPAAIVVFDGGTAPTYLYVGDRLPNKATITGIKPDSLTVRTLINQRWVLVTLDL